MIDAKLCRHCNSRQGIDRLLQFSSTVLALLVALVSVVSTSAPTIQKLIEGDQSRVLLSNPVWRGEQLDLVAANHGRKAGTIGNAVLRSPLFDQPIDVTLADNEEALVGNGERPAHFRVRLHLSATDALALALDRGVLGPNHIEVGLVIVMVRQSNGDPAYFPFPIFRGDMIRLLEAHAHHCQNASKTDFPDDCKSIPAPGGKPEGGKGK